MIETSPGGAKDPAICRNKRTALARLFLAVNVTDDPVEVLLYTRAKCHLCDEAKQQIRALQKEAPFRFQEVDIDQDPELRQRYNEQVPVVFIHGRKAFKYRIDPVLFLKRLVEGRK